MPQSQLTPPQQRSTPSRTVKRSPRAQVRIEAWLETLAGEVFDCCTLNVSDSGACIGGLGIPVHVGDRVRLSLMRSSAMDEGWLEAVVRWRTAERIGLEILPRRRDRDGPRGS